MPKLKIQVDNYEDRQKLICILAGLGYKTWVEEHPYFTSYLVRTEYYVLAELPGVCFIWDNVYDKEPIKDK